MSPLFVLGYFSRLTQRMDHSLVRRELTTNTLVPTLQQANCSSITDQLNGVVVPAGIGGLKQDVSGYKNLLVNSANHYDPMPNEELPRSTFYDNQADAVDKLNQNRQAYNDNGCDTLDSDNDMVCSHGPLAEQFDSAAVTIYRDMSDKQGTDFEIRSRDDILNDQQFNSSLLPNGYVHYVFKNATTQWLYSIDDQGAFYDTNNQKLNLPFFYDSISGFNLVRKSLVPVCDSLDFLIQFMLAHLIQLYFRMIRSVKIRLIVTMILLQGILAGIQPPRYPVMGTRPFLLITELNRSY